MAKGRDVYHNLNNNSDGRLDDNIVDADYKRKEPSVAIDGEMTRAKVHCGQKVVMSLPSFLVFNY